MYEPSRHQTSALESFGTHVNPFEHWSQRTKQRYSPYRTLWLRVIIRAAFDYAQNKTSRDLRNRRVAEEAYRWLFEENHSLFSFQNLCEAYGFPRERLREWARKITKKDVKKMEQLDDRRSLLTKERERAALEEEDGGDS